MSYLIMNYFLDIEINSKNPELSSIETQTRLKVRANRPAVAGYVFLSRELTGLRL
jgi:hypothetical protein